MNPNQLANLFNNMDEKGAANFAAALNAMGATDEERRRKEEEAALSQRLTRLLPLDVWQLVATPKLLEKLLPAEAVAWVPSRRLGRVAWVRLLYVLPMLTAVLGAVGGVALAWALSGLTAPFLDVLMWAAGIGAAAGAVVGLAVKIYRLGTTDGKAPADATLPAGGEIIAGGLCGAVFGAILGCAWWLINTDVGMAVCGGGLGALAGGLLLRIPLGDLARRGQRLFQQAEKAAEEKQWQRAEELYTAAARLRAVAGKPSERWLTLHNFAWAMQPDRNPQGDWNRAAALVLEAALLGESAAVKDVGGTFFNLADCLSPLNNPAGNWNGTAAALAKAARLRTLAGNKRCVGDSLWALAQSQRPDKNPAGNWATAAALFAEAGRAAEAAEDPKTQGVCLHQEAYCRMEGGTRSPDQEGRTLLERAVEVSRQAGDEESAKASASWLK
jgi:hypothetical protein